jgi:predicted GTPase
MQIKSIADASSLAKLGGVKKEVLRAGAEVESRLNTQVSVFVNDILKELESHTCRIALIGQIKAGKSSLANALIRKPGLLPTDVNPSTAVVTKVFVGAPAEKQNSALFHFFSDAEWDRLMRGGRFDVVEPTPQKLLSDGNKKLAELRQRAEHRLGRDYAKHLGKHHLFSAVTPGLLEQYVSAGDYADESASKDTNALALFSDITKEAEVFLDGQPFAYPTVIIDTPGTNDPFFVRDEITHAYLAGADVYLVVLTAHRPLSESDLALFRMLKGLQRDKIIAVINRMDVLPNIVGELDRLTSAVRSALHREFPNTVIPVVATSALWANSALESMTSGRMPPYIETAARSAERLGVAQQSELTAWQNGDQDKAARIAELLYGLSGITGVINMVSRLIGNAVTEEQLLPSTSTLSAVTENTAISLRFGSHALDPSRSSFHNRSPQHQALRGKTESNLNNVKTLLDSIEQILQDAENDLSQQITNEFHRIEKYMFYTVERFAESQTDSFAIKGISPAFQAEFARESLRLRSELAEDFAHHFGTLYRALNATQRDVETRLRQTAKSVLPSLDDVLHYGVPSSRIPSVSSISLSKVTAFDLDDFWQGAILRGVGPESQVENFKLLVRSEYIFMLRELFDDARKDLDRQMSTSTRRLRFMTYSAIHPFVEQLRQIATHYRDVIAQQQDATIRTEAKLKGILDQWRNEVTAFERLAEQLKNLKKQCFLIAAG